jgi:hypothetical protein
MPFALDRSSAPPDPPALADYEGGARRALDEARALAGPEGEMRPQATTEGMSSQLLQKAGGASPRTRVALPRQRRPLHEHADPEATFMREFEVRPGPRVASRASPRPHPRVSTEESTRVRAFHVDVNLERPTGRKPSFRLDVGRVSEARKGKDAFRRDERVGVSENAFTRFFFSRQPSRQTRAAPPPRPPPIAARPADLDPHDPHRTITRTANPPTRPLLSRFIHASYVFALKKKKKKNRRTARLAATPSRTSRTS